MTMRRRTLLASLGAGVARTVGAAGSRSALTPVVRGTDADGGSDDGDRDSRGSEDPGGYHGRRGADAPLGERSTWTLLAGTRYATPVVTVDGPQEGPTVVVVGGLHGDERAGYRTAEEVAAADVAAGRLVAVPRANRPAIEADRREGVGGDLNRQFPPNETPTTRLARALWEVVADADPDVVLDLHRSTGIYRVHRGSVGQAVFPTVTGDATAYATAAVEHVNRTEVPWYMPAHDYTQANRIDGTAPLLVHKVAADLGVAGYIVETTNFLVALDTQIDWGRAIAEHLLRSHGLVRPRNGGGTEDEDGETTAATSASTSTPGGDT
jgi:predicted deacylase